MLSLQIMDKTTVALIGLGIVALAFIAFFVVFRSKGKGKIKGPFGIGLDVEGSNQAAPDPAVTVKDATSRKGGLSADDATGRGANVERVDVESDIRVSSSAPWDKKPPKA